MIKRTSLYALGTALILVFNIIFGFYAFAYGENSYYTERPILVVSEGKMLTFDTSPVIIEGRTLVPLRPVLESFRCDILWDDKTDTVKASDDRITVEIKIGGYWLTVYDKGIIKTYQLDVPAMIINDRTYLPLRKIAEVFGAYVYWNDSTNTVTISKNLTNETVKQTHTYYFQNEEQWQLPKYGSGYCWVCSYAMVINDITGGVTPVDIKSVNEEYLDDGAICHHVQIADRFGLRFVPAVDEQGEYFDRFEYDYGATYIKNPDKSDLVATLAITEALKRHPEGVLVRFEEHPHTMVAIGNVGGQIIFNEPASEWGSYSDKGMTEGVTFDKTYPCKMGHKLSDMAYIQALD